HSEVVLLEGDIAPTSLLQYGGDMPGIGKGERPRRSGRRRRRGFRKQRTDLREEWILGRRTKAGEKQPRLRRRDRRDVPECGRRILEKHHAMTRYDEVGGEFRVGSPARCIRTSERDISPAFAPL